MRTDEASIGLAVLVQSQDANVVKLYKHLESIVNQAWDERLAPRKKNGTAKGAPYNWFMSAKEKKHKAKAAWQRWESSTQKLVCNNKELIAEFRSDEHVRMVIERYRAIAKVDREKRAVEQEEDWTGEKLDWGM